MTLQMAAAGLRKSYGGNMVLESVDVELHRGEVVLLKGANGSGKTTLLNILSGYLQADGGSLAIDDPGEGKVCFSFPIPPLQGLLRARKSFSPERLSRLGVVRTWQDIRLFSELTLLENLLVGAAGGGNHGPLDALLRPRHSARFDAGLRDSALAALGGLGLAERAGSRADRISLGQSKRVSIARAMLAGARVLLLDEPLAGLDRNGAVDVTRMLKDLVARHSVSIVVVEHASNETHFNGLVTTEWVLSDGRIERQANAHAAPLADNHPGIERLAHGHTLSTRHHQSGCLLTTLRSAGTNAAATSEMPVLAINALKIRRGSHAVLGQYGEQPAAGFDLSVFAGETVILQAPNGWGKSSLLAALMGLMPTEGGDIRLMGQDITTLPTWDRVRKGVVALRSDANIFPGLTVAESRSIGVHPAAGPSSLPENRFTESLSGGERQRAMLESLPAGVVRILDEPFGALDEATLSDPAFIARHFAGRTQLILMPLAHAG